MLAFKHNMYGANLMHTDLTDLIPSNHVLGQLCVVAMVEIQEERDPFEQWFIIDNLEMVDIPESILNNLIPQLRDHVKKFVVPHITNDNENTCSVSTDDVFTNSFLFTSDCARNICIKFYVNTTSDEILSNCKYTPGKRRSRLQDLSMKVKS